MIKENTKLCDQVLSVVNEELKKRKMDHYIPLFPMLRNEENCLYFSVMIVKDDDSIWKRENKTMPFYWVLLDIENLNIIEFNDVHEKSFQLNTAFTPELTDLQSELSKYEVSKIIQYKTYLMNDIKNDEIPLQRELLKALNNKIVIDGEEVDAKDYMMANIEEEVSKKIEELIHTIMGQKYGSISYFYGCLLENIITEYKSTKHINTENIEVAINVMNHYYEGIVGIRELFNI